MKFLRTLGYLLVLGFKLWLGNKQQKRTMAPTAKQRGTALIYLLSTLVLFCGFVQFWLLTGKFPFVLFLALMGASLIGLLINTMIGALAGFGIAEKREKVRVLTLIWGVQQWKIGCVALCIVVLVLIFSTVASLWVFWKNPIGASNAVGWIAFYEFILLQLVAIPLQPLLMWSMMTSEYVDDDFRNATLSQHFATLFQSAVALVYPVWLFKKEIGGIFHLPPFWVILSVPFVVFLAGAVLPYVIGFWKYRALRQALLSWRRNWLNEVLILTRLPIGDKRSAGIDTMLQKLELEVGNRVREHKVLEVFQRLGATESSDDQLYLPAVEPEVPELPTATAETVIDVQSEASVVSHAETGVARRSGTDFFYKLNPYQRLRHETGDQSDPLAAIKEAIQTNKGNLIEWDIHFAHVGKLMNLRPVVQDGKSKDVSQFIEANVKDLDAQLTDKSGKKSVVLATIWSIVSTAVVWVFKTFQPQITSVIEKLVSTS